MQTRLKFDRDQVAALCARLSKNAEIVLVKDDGIYLMSFAKVVGDRTIVYARGFNPKVDGDIWQKSCDAVGGDDFGEPIGEVRTWEDVLDKSDGDLVVAVDAETVALQYSPKRRAKQGVH